MKKILLTLGFILPSMAWAQTGVSGAAPVTLELEGVDCGGQCITVAVQVDVSGLTGTSNPAGLNAFVLAFDLDRPDVFASVRPGTFPLLDWQFFATRRDLVRATNRLVLVGAVADETAPNQSYQVATIVLCGSVGPVTFSLVESESSLGSRWLPGDNPGPIAIDATSLPFQTTIAIPFPLTFGEGIASWLQDVPDYDLAGDIGPINVQDLVKLIDCGEP